MLFNNKKRDYKSTIAQRASPDNASGNSSGYKKEIGGVFLTTLVMFLALACISYSPHDNTLFHFASSRHITANWAGAVGANIAAFLFYLLGSAAYIFLACLCLLSYRLFIKKAAGNSLLNTIPLIILLATTATLGSSVRHRSGLPRRFEESRRGIPRGVAGQDGRGQRLHRRQCRSRRTGGPAGG